MDTVNSIGHQASEELAEIRALFLFDQASTGTAQAIRNATVTIAPTGTPSIIAGGILRVEPVFACLYPQCDGRHPPYRPIRFQGQAGGGGHLLDELMHMQKSWSRAPWPTWTASPRTSGGVRLRPTTCPHLACENAGAFQRHRQRGEQDGELPQLRHQEEVAEVTGWPSLWAARAPPSTGTEAATSRCSTSARSATARPPPRPGGGRRADSRLRARPA